MGVRGLVRCVREHGRPVAHPPPPHSPSESEDVTSWVEEFLARNSEGVQRAPLPLDLRRASMAFLEERGQRLTVVVDGCGLVYHLYKGMGSAPEWIIGGEYRALKREAVTFFRSFTSVGMDVRVIFDGPREKRKEATNVQRMKEKASTAAAIQGQLVSKGNSFDRVKGDNSFLRPLLASDAVRMTVKQLEISGEEECAMTVGKVTAFFAPGEADGVIAQYCASTPHCLAVIANDSDFLVFPGIRYVPFNTLSSGDDWLTASCYQTASTMASLAFDQHMELVAVALALGTDHVDLNSGHLDDKGVVALLERVRCHFDGGGDLGTFLKKCYSTDVTDEVVAGALNFYCCYGDAEREIRRLGVPSALQELSSPFCENSLQEQRVLYKEGFIDDQFFDVVKQGRLLMPLPLDNPPGDRNPAILLSPLRQRLYLMVNGGKALSVPVREFFAYNASVKVEDRGTASLQLPTFKAPIDPSLSKEQRDKLSKMQYAMWVLFGDAVSHQGEATAADIQGWDSPFGSILLLTRMLLFSDVGSKWKTWEYHGLLAYFASLACQPLDKTARALGSYRVPRGALGRFLWLWSVIELAVQHLNWTIGACGLSRGQMDPSSWLCSTTFLHYHKELTAAIDHKNVRHDLLRTDSIRHMVQGDLLFNNPQYCRAYELLERIMRLGLPDEAVAPLGSAPKAFVQTEGRNEWEEWIWTISNSEEFSTDQQACVAAKGVDATIPGAGAKKKPARSSRKKKVKAKRNGKKK